MARAISVMRSEPDGILYSNSIVAWIFHLLSRMRRRTSAIASLLVEFGSRLAFRLIRRLAELAQFTVVSLGLLFPVLFLFGRDQQDVILLGAGQVGLEPVVIFLRDGIELVVGGIVRIRPLGRETPNRSHPSARSGLHCG